MVVKKVMEKLGPIEKCPYHKLIVQFYVKRFI